MKKIILSYLFLSLYTYSSYSAVITKSETEYKTQKDKNNIEITQYFETEYSRIETKVKVKKEQNQKQEQNSIVIIRNDKKLIWTIIPEQKGYCEFSFDEIKKYLNSGSNLIPQGIKIPNDLKFEKTERSEKIAGFSSIEYDFKKDKEKGKIWISEDAKLNLITEFYKNMTKSMGNNSFKSNGVSLRLESKTDDVSYKTEVQSIKFQEADKNLFELPQGYTKLNKDIWKEYQKNFDHNLIIEELKRQMREKIKEHAVEEGKNAIKKGLKGAIGF